MSAAEIYKLADLGNGLRQKCNTVHRHDAINLGINGVPAI